MKRNVCVGMLAVCCLGALAPARQSTLFTGLRSDPLGAAGIQVDATSGFLLISNIGSSGQDGLRIHHPGLLGIDVELAPVTSVQTGMRLETRCVGSLDGAPGQTLALGVAEEISSGEAALRVTFPHAASNAKRVEFRRHGALLAAVDGVTADEVGRIVPVESIATMWPTDVHYEAEIVDYTPSGMPIYRFIAKYTFAHMWSDLIPDLLAYVRVPNGQEVHGIDELDIFSDVIDETIVLDHTDVTMSHSPDFVIQALGTVALDNRHVLGIDNSILTNGISGLQVTNIGSSGQDGVAVALPDSDSFLLELAGLPQASTLPIGARLELNSKGVLDGQPHQVLGALRLTKSAGPLVANVSCAGAASLLVELFDQGSLVAVASMPQGDVLRFGPLPTRVGQCDLALLGCGFLAQWASAVQVTIPGTGTFAANEARVSAIGASAVVAEIEVARLMGKSLGAFQIASVQSSGVPSPSTYCTAKVNSLGCTPAIGFTGEPSLSIDDLVITAAGVLNQKSGLMLFGLAPAAIPFQGGHLCVQPPLFRTATQSSAGNSGVSDCSGAFALAFTAAMAAQHGLAPGDVTYAQYWYRDSQSPSTTGLTDALALEWRP